MICDVILSMVLKLYIKLIFTWEYLANEEASKRELVTKIMNVANEIYESNKEDQEVGSHSQIT